MIVAGLEQLFALAEWDEVAYIYPASPDLVEGRPVIACSGALTEFAAIGQYVAQVGKGWSGDSTGRVTLQYHFGQLSAKLTPDQARAEIERALKEWALHARLNFVPGPSATTARTINFLFASGGHGDPYPFDGPGKTLAHTFYPSPPNSEPLAGDVHFDDDEGWRIGADTDLYSVALHELGHSLGLGHSDLPGAVMYPFYRSAETLTPEDERAIQGLYAPPDAGGTPPTPPPAPPQPESLHLTITAPGTQYVTSAVTLTLTGALSGGTAPLSLSWSSDRGPSGTAAAAGLWSISGVPLAIGRNLISVVGADALLQQAAQSVAVTREAAPAQPTGRQGGALADHPIPGRNECAGFPRRDYRSRLGARQCRRHRGDLVPVVRAFGRGPGNNLLGDRRSAPAGRRKHRHHPGARRGRQRRLALRGNHPPLNANRGQCLRNPEINFGISSACPRIRSASRRRASRWCRRGCWRFAG